MSGRAENGDRDERNTDASLFASRVARRPRIQRREPADYEDHGRLEAWPAAIDPQGPRSASGTPRQTHALAQRALLASERHHQELLSAYFEHDWRAFRRAARDLRGDANRLVGLIAALEDARG